MKLLVSMLLICLATVCSRAQVKVMLVTDSTDQKILKELDKQYPPAVSPREQATTRDLVFQKITGDYWLDFTRFLYRKGFRPDTSVTIYVTGYFQPTGRADVLLLYYGGIRQRNTNSVLLPPRLNAANGQLLIGLLTDYLTSQPLPVSSSLIMAPFRLSNNLSLPSPTSRKTPRGPGVIGDLRTAAATTRPDTVKRLLLNSLQLQEVPEVVYRFTQVEEISLSRNYLTHLPARLTTLPHLQRLDLAWNQLQDDSIAFARNRHLKAITLQNNALMTIPRALRRNRRLESLWLGNNDLQTLAGQRFSGLRRVNDLNLYNARLTTLPKQVAKLRRLKVLDLYYNGFTTLPATIGRLRRLEQLAIAHNKLTELPDALSHLTQLTTLFAHHNQLDKLPETLSRLPRLKVLDVGYNDFRVIPAGLASVVSLEELDLSNNNLQELSASLTQLPHLKKLYLRQNPFLRSQALTPAAKQLIDRLEANRTEVFH